MSLPGQTLDRIKTLSLMAALSSSMLRLDAGFALPESSVTYDGDIHWPRILFDGLAKPATHISRSVVDGESEEVFSNLPTTLNLSYQSLSFSATRTTMLGNLVNLAGTPRIANHAEAVLVTWATAAKYPSWAAEDPSGYTHPVTVRLYQMETSGSSTTLRELESLKVLVHIPWRPATLADGSAYPYNGYAFKVILPLSGQILVSNPVIIALSYDTQATGLTPTGTPGPFNELNVGLSGLKPRIGTDPDSASVFWVKDGIWSYPASNWGSVGSPMLSLSARPVPLSAPVLSNNPPPLHAGFHHVRSTFADGTQIDTVQAISKARATISATNTDKSIEDEDIAPAIITSPAGLPYRITYNGTDTAPTTPGFHSYQVMIDSLDYEGNMSGQIHLSAPRYEQWAAKAFSGINLQEAGSRQDPDRDGINNLLEYAMGSDPLMRDSTQPLKRQDGASAFTYRVRKEMPGTSLGAEMSEDLHSWKEATAEIVNSDEFWENRRVKSDKARAFFRLKANSP